MFVRGGLITLVALAVYLALATPDIHGNDNAEFTTLGTVGGIAHPSGYPGYILYLRALAWLPGSSAAHTTAIATIVLAALQLAVLHAACRAWGARPLAATLAVGIYAAGPIVMRYSTEAEAFAPNQLVVACVLWLAAKRGPLRGIWRAAALGLVAGLGMSNHLTCTIVAPVGILGVVRAAQELRSIRFVAFGVAALTWLVGLLPYLYLFVAPDNLQSWRAPENLGELVDLVLRRQYGGAFGFTGGDAPVPYLAQVRELVLSLGRAWAWVGLPIGLLALGHRIARAGASASASNDQAEPRTGWLALAACFVVAGPLLATQFNLPTDDLGLYVVRRFHLLPILFLVIPVAAGLTTLGAVAARRLGDRMPRPFVGHLIGVLVFGGLATTSLPYLQRLHSPAMDRSVRNTLGAMPPDAVILAGAVDELDVGIRYLQLAEGERPDVLLVRWRSLAVDWYGAKFAPYGLQIDPRHRVLPPARDHVLGVATAEYFLAFGRPVFVDPWEVGIRAELPTYPYGILVRVLPRGTTAPSLDEVFAMNKALFAKFDLAYPAPGKHDEFATWIHRKYAGTWARLSDALRRAGRIEDAAFAYELARQLQPQN